MDQRIVDFFRNAPGALPLFEEAAKMIASLGESRVEAAKTQISFGNRYRFAWIWLPIRKMKGRPELYIVLSFGLDHAVRSPRIAEVVQPRTGRFTHHMIIEKTSDLDEELRSWLVMAYAFSMRCKGERI